MRYAPAILVGRFVRFAARLRKPGGGSAIPGLIVNKIAPGYLQAHPVGLPAGTRGRVGLERQVDDDEDARRDPAGARRRRVHQPVDGEHQPGPHVGAARARRLAAGACRGDVAVLEMDEGHGALVMQGVDAARRRPHQRDGRPDRPVPRLRHGRRPCSRASPCRRHEAVVVNADDAIPRTIWPRQLRSDVAVHRFGVSPEVLDASPRGLGYTETSPERLADGTGVRVTAVNGADGGARRRRDIRLDRPAGARNALRRRCRRGVLDRSGGAGRALLVGDRVARAQRDPGRSSAAASA